MTTRKGLPVLGDVPAPDGAACGGGCAAGPDPAADAPADPRRRAFLRTAAAGAAVAALGGCGVEGFLRKHL